MLHFDLRALLMLSILGLSLDWARPQALGEADRGEPADPAVQNYLHSLAGTYPERFLEGISSAGDWEKARPALAREYAYMLGLPMSRRRTPLQVTRTGTVEGDGYVVELLHYQSLPGLYVTANLYRPAEVPGKKMPAILYVCGHAPRPRDGNKAAYQSHGIWFARHGYVCLIVDTLQLGEIAAYHHGTYREERWWWHSRGYTPAGVEAWNGIRGIDYLMDRPDVDRDRIGVTGISGGGAATLWIAGADDRVKVAVPVSGMADLPSYVGNRVVNGHCDCMFFYNTFRWPWTRIAALVAPRPMLFANSHQDSIFPMDANGRVSNRLEMLYSLFGAGHHFETLVSRGGHAYREDIRRGVFRFFNMHFKGDASPVLDSEIDLVTESDGTSMHPIPPSSLRAFPTDSDIPSDQLNTTIDHHFVPLAKPQLPAVGDFQEWKKRLLAQLRKVSFAPAIEYERQGAHLQPGDQGPPTKLKGAFHGRTRRRLLVVDDGNAASDQDWARELSRSGERIVHCSPRGVGETRWTSISPPNYVKRSQALLGFTVDALRVRDVAATAQHLAASTSQQLRVAGRGGGGILAAYAAHLVPQVQEVVVVSPPASHMDSDAPQLLNVLRVCDIPEVLGMLAPRHLTLVDAPEALVERVRSIYRRAGAEEQLVVRP